MAEFVPTNGKNPIEIFVDGGARGNPGLAAAAFVIPSLRQRGARVLPQKKTNNEAEYYALLYALAFAEVANLTHIRVFTDSQTVANQINGPFGCYEPRLRKLLNAARASISKFLYFEIILVKRHKNKEADALVRKTLDEAKAKNAI